MNNPLYPSRTNLNNEDTAEYITRQNSRSLEKLSNLETDVAWIKETVRELKTDVKEELKDIKELLKKLEEKIDSGIEKIEAQKYLSIKIAIVLTIASLYGKPLNDLILDFFK